MLFFTPSRMKKRQGQQTLIIIMDRKIYFRENLKHYLSIWTIILCHNLSMLVSTAFRPESVKSRHFCESIKIAPNIYLGQLLKNNIHVLITFFITVVIEWYDSMALLNINFSSIYSFVVELGALKYHIFCKLSKWPKMYLFF